MNQGQFVKQRKTQGDSKRTVGDECDHASRQGREHLRLLGSEVVALLWVIVNPVQAALGSAYCDASRRAGVIGRARPCTHTRPVRKGLHVYTALQQIAMESQR
jgi:hypothetical protein